MQNIKSMDQIKFMRQAGLIVWEAHQEAAKIMAPGITTRELDAAIESHIVKRGGIALFKGVPGPIPYPNASCISVNEEVVHGMPGDRKLADGDVVGIDIGVKYRGWCGDAAVTHAVGKIDSASRRLLDVTEEVLRYAIVELGKKHKYWKFIARGMADIAHENGFSVVRSLVGHNIGKKMWEPPQIPNYPDERMDFKIKQGMVMAIEPMLNAGVYEVKTLEDGWTIVTEDLKRSAHFEHSIALTADGPKVLTMGPNCEGWSLPEGITDLPGM